MLRGARSGMRRANLTCSNAHSLLTNGGIAYSLHRRSGVPYIVAVRDTDINVLLKRMPHLRPLARRILKHASKVIFLSSSYRDRALAPYLSREEQAEVAAKSAVVPNGIDALWLKDRPAPREAANPTEAKLLFVGRLTARKNLPAAIRAAEALAARGRVVKLTVVGQPAEEKWRGPPKLARLLSFCRRGRWRN